MPTLDDAPIVPRLNSETANETDLVQIYDVSEQKPKTITVAALAAAIDAINNPD
jgi:hypothetical protein